ncbi:MAG: pyridoxal-dependent decarboxylase [Pseudorhodobacter sp.]|nr:pyridoxal-dependent decarboxylase [Pseudorhodobacter sp.]
MTSAAREDTLDPADWTATLALAHRMVEDAVAHLRDVRARPVWQAMPDAVRHSYDAPLPQGPTPLAEVWDDLRANLMPYPMGNIHPRFFMWYMGAGTFTGALGEFLAAIDGSNLGGGNNAAPLMDAQVTGWIRTMMGFPESASGTLVDGGSKANIIGLTVARNVMAGVDVREEGVAAIPQPLRFYTSDQVHSCHQKAVELLGLGNRALARVQTDDACRIDLPALAKAIADDRAAGLKPACVIATAGTTNTGAIDDLPAIRDLCRREGLWFHVDGCIGALVRIAPHYRHLVVGIEDADSLALDLHKWLHAPFEAGFALVRDRAQHLGAFAVHPEYLEEKPRGIAAGEYLHNYGLQTSRGFRALKLWMLLNEHGTAKFGRLIDQNIEQARYFAEAVRAESNLTLMAPTVLNIVCFRYDPGGRDEAGLRALNTEIMLRLQEAGIAALSDTTVKGCHCLRMAICNHRTRREDLDLVVREGLRIGGEVFEEHRGS